VNQLDGLLDSWGMSQQRPQDRSHDKLAVLSEATAEEVFFQKKQQLEIIARQQAADVLRL
jgi:hypothetical protein